MLLLHRHIEHGAVLTMLDLLLPAYCPQELQVRFKKAIFEYVILAGSTFSRSQVSHGLDRAGYVRRVARSCRRRLALRVAPLERAAAAAGDAAARLRAA